MDFLGPPAVLQSDERGPYATPLSDISLPPMQGSLPLSSHQLAREETGLAARGTATPPLANEPVAASECDSTIASDADADTDYSPHHLTADRLEQHRKVFRDAGIGDGDGECGEVLVAETADGAATASPARPLAERLCRSWEKIKVSLVFFRARLRAMTWRQLLWVVFLVVLVMAGNAMQILMLNFWLVSFPENGTPGNYTAFAVPGVLFSLFFVLVLAVYVVVKRPGMRFARHRYGWWLLIGVGFCDTFNSWLATYAASYTSEVLQALFTNLCPLYAVFMSKWILHDPRKYLNGWIVSVFILTIVGILAASLYSLIETPHMAGGKIWIFLFFLSIPFRVLMNVWQSLYMIVYTRDPAFTEWLGLRFRRGVVGGVGLGAAAAPGDVGLGAGGKHLASGAEDNLLGPVASGALDEFVADELEQHRSSARMIIAPPPSVCSRELPAEGSAHCDGTSDSHRSGFREAHAQGAVGGGVGGSGGASAALTQEIVSVRYHQGEDMIVKLVMLAGETFVQMCFTLALLPADALPWWGNSATVRETWSNFVEGIVCVFTIRNNFIFGFLYTLGFVLTYAGCAYLNHYSVALCSIVSQLSSPLTALLLVLVPSWNVQEGGDSPWYCNLLAIVLLSVAAFVCVVWEEMTDAEKVEGERVLKMKKLRVRPLENDVLLPDENSFL